MPNTRISSEEYAHLETHESGPFGWHLATQRFKTRSRQTALYGLA
jgi:hypothetical protein